MKLAHNPYFVPGLALFSLIGCYQKQPQSRLGSSASSCLSTLPIQVYVTYIPPEGDLLSKAIIDRHACCPVIVIQNGHDPSNIFKRPLGFYGTPSAVYLVSRDRVQRAGGNTTQQREASADFAEQLKNALSKDPQFLLPQQAGLDSSDRQNPDLHFTVFAFRSDLPGQPAVLMESVETGRTPSYMHANTIVLQALEQLANKHRRKLYLTSFGTGGGVDPSHGVGSVVELTGSVFVGYAADVSQGQSRYVPQIRSIDKESGAESNLYAGKAGYSTRQQAELDAKTHFLELFANPTLPETDGPQGSPLKSLTARRSYSLTVTEIGTEDIKKRSQDLSLKNVNMEDYHIIRSWQILDSQSKGGLKVLRIISDTHGASTRLAARALSWARSHTYSLADYAELILWGLSGSPTQPADRVPLAALWTAFAGVEASALLPFLAPLQTQPTTLFLDPFAKEFAETFMSDIQAQRFFSAESLGPGAHALVGQSELSVQNLVTNHHKVLQQQLDVLRATAHEPAKALDAATELARSMAYITLSSKQSLALLALGDLPATNPVATRMHIWARLGKWSKNSSVSLRSVTANFKGADAFKKSPVFDRMFYRSNMSTAMPQGIQKVLESFVTCN